MKPNLPNPARNHVAQFLWIGAAAALLIGSIPARSATAESPLAISTITASSDDGNVAANTVDGSLSTRWSAEGDGQWILYDLGSSATVTSVHIAWYQGNKRTTKFDVQTSLNGSTWTTVFSGSSSGKTLNLEVYDVADSAGRYVRIIGHGNTANKWNSITETKILGVPASTPPPTVSEEQLPVSTVCASANDGNLPANTLDGSLATRWSAQGNGQWILFDLGASKTITSVDVAWHQGNTRIETFDIQTSQDGSLWMTVFCGSSCGKTLNLETFDVVDSVGRLVRIVGHGNNVNTWNSITEVQIFGPAAGTPPPPPTVILPADVLDLTNWKLTLPVNTAHAGSPDEIQQPELDGFQDSQYFHTNASCNGVVFRAPCGGATTSGSGYPRSELREMANNGLSLASWSTTAGTHTMIVTQAITHLPVVKPHVVAGQIHDSNDDVIVFRLEGQKLFVDQNGTTGPVLTSQYQLGDVFTVAFVARNGGVECYYNGAYVYTYQVSASGCYFKTGCYTQSNTSKGDAPDAYGEVVVYGVSVSHQ